MNNRIDRKLLDFMHENRDSLSPKIRAALWEAWHIAYNETQPQQKDLLHNTTPSAWVRNVA
jgi:hypothetical protein